MVSSPSSSATASAAAPRPVTLVTGGARRIGRQIALDLAAHGHDVAVHCHHSREDAEATVQDLQALGASATVVQADLTAADAADVLLRQIQAHFGRLDAIVNNASVFEYDSAWTAGPQSIARHVQVNTIAPVLLAQMLARHVNERGVRGCVVNLIDQKLWNPNPDYFSYTVSKAALQEATVLLAQALAPQVRVVGVAPGVTLLSGPMSTEEYERAHRMTPLERSSTPDDIARAVRFLLESPAITGTTLLVDGGQHLTGQHRDVLFLAQQTS